MAKVNGMIKIEGTLENLTFYKSGSEHFVRTKGGVSKSRIMNDPAFVRTRENGSEFSSIAASGKLLRTALGPFLFKAKDSRLSSRMLQLFSKVKNLDATSIRGLRNVADGFLDPQAKALLVGFDFNVRASLGSVLNSSILVDSALGQLTFGAFDPTQQLKAPEGATHFSMQSGFLVVDFATGEYSLALSDELVFPLVLGEISPVLTPISVPTGTGVAMQVVLLEFFQQVNGSNYLLNNGAYNVLHVVAVQ
jgi:hypothetical protein